MDHYDRTQAKPRGLVARRLDLNSAMNIGGHGRQPKAAPIRREDSSDDDSPYPTMISKSRVPDWRRAKEANGTTAHSNALFDKLGIKKEASFSDDSDASSWEGSPIKSYPTGKDADAVAQATASDTRILELQTTQLAAAQLSAAQAQKQLTLEKATNAGLQQEITSAQYELQCLRKTASEQLGLAEQQDTLSSQTELLRRQVTSLQAGSERVEAERSALMTTNESLVQELNDARLRATVAEENAQRAVENTASAIAVVESTHLKDASRVQEELKKQLRVTKSTCENAILRAESAEESLRNTLAEKAAFQQQAAEALEAKDVLKSALEETKAALDKAQEQHYSASSNSAKVIAELQAYVAQASARNTSEIEALHSDLTRTRSELQAKAQELEHARQQHAFEVQSVRSELADAKQSAISTQSQLDLLQNELDAARSAMAGVTSQAENEVVSLRASLTEAQNRAAETESILFKAQEEAFNHRKDATTLKEQLAALQAEEAEQSTSLALAIEQSVAAETKAAGFEALLHTAWNDRDAALYQAESFESRAAALEVELNNLRSQLDSAAGQSTEADAKIAALEAEINSAQSNCDSSIQAKAVVEARVVALEAELHNAFTERDTAQAELKNRVAVVPSYNIQHESSERNNPVAAPISAPVFTHDTFWTSANAGREGLVGVVRKRSSVVGDLETGSAYDTDSSDGAEERGKLVSLALRLGAAPAAAVAVGRWMDGAVNTARQASYRHQKFVLAGMLLYSLLIHLALAGTGLRCGAGVSGAV